MDEERVMDVFLDDARPSPRLGTVFNNASDLVFVLRNLDSYASVRVLAWLDDPDVAR